MKSASKKIIYFLIFLSVIIIIYVFSCYIFHPREKMTLEEKKKMDKALTNFFTEKIKVVIPMASTAIMEDPSNRKIIKNR